MEHPHGTLWKSRSTRGAPTVKRRRWAEGETMEDMFRLFQEARRIPVSILRGTRIYTIGGSFYGLSTRDFRGLLRRAGARIDPLARQSTDLIVVGDDPSRSAIIRILLTLSEKSRPPFVKQGPFLLRFFGELRDLEVSRGLTFQGHLESFAGFRNSFVEEGPGTYFHEFL